MLHKRVRVFLEASVWWISAIVVIGIMGAVLGQTIWESAKLLWDAAVFFGLDKVSGTEIAAKGSFFFCVMTLVLGMFHILVWGEMSAPARFWWAERIKYLALRTVYALECVGLVMLGVYLALMPPQHLPDPSVRFMGCLTISFGFLLAYKTRRPLAKVRN